MGFYALFASIAKTLVFTKQLQWWEFKKGKNAIDQTLSTPIDEIFSFIEFEKALERG